MALYGHIYLNVIVFSDYVRIGFETCSLPARCACAIIKKEIYWSAKFKVCTKRDERSSLPDGIYAREKNFLSQERTFYAQINTNPIVEVK